ncbi:MAG: carbohydrate-binding protein [Enterocloster sp.]
MQTGVCITVRNKERAVKAEISGSRQAVLAWKGEYEPGDQIEFKVDRTKAFYVIRVDDVMDEALVYLTKDMLVYEVPFEEKKTAVNPKAFTGERHYLTLRRAEDYEIRAYRNLAKNAADQHADNGCYPHAWANVETRGEAVFAARNAIDGVLANLSHGRWPYESWGINMQDDAQITVEFGRAVDFDTIVLYTRADFPHDNWWVQVTLTFSDGTSLAWDLDKRTDPHVLKLEKKGIRWVRLEKLIKADDPSPFPALTQIEIYGTESEKK